MTFAFLATTLRLAFALSLISLYGSILLSTVVFALRLVIVQRPSYSLTLGILYI